MFVGVPKHLFRVHNWRTDVVTVVRSIQYVRLLQSVASRISWASRLPWAGLDVSLAKHRYASTYERDTHIYTYKNQSSLLLSCCHDFLLCPCWRVTVSLLDLLSVAVMNCVSVQGKVPSEMVRAASDGNVDEEWPAQVNKLLWEGDHDNLFSSHTLSPFSTTSSLLTLL